MLIPLSDLSIDGCRITFDACDAKPKAHRPATRRLTGSRGTASILRREHLTRRCDSQASAPHMNTANNVPSNRQLRQLSTIGYRRQQVDSEAELWVGTYSLMVGLLIIFVLLAIGFAAGYGTRELISRKRHTEYLNLQPYVSPALRTRQPSSDESTRTRYATPQPAMTERTSHDMPQSFQGISIREPKPLKPAGPAGASLRLVEPHLSEPDTSSLQSVRIEQSLEELVGLLLRKKQER